MAPKRGRPASGQQVAGRVAALKSKPKRGRSSLAAAASLQDDYFQGDSEDEGGARGSKQQEQAQQQAQQEREEAEALETAEDKRLRLAKEYLTQLRAHLDTDRVDRRGVTGDSDGEGGSQDEEEEQGGEHDRLATLLRQDAAQAAGRVQRQVASRLRCPTYSDGVTAAAAGRARGGHRLPPTALALAEDESCAWTVSKDGSLCRWDMATGTRTHLHWPGVAGAHKRQGSKGQPARGPGGGAEWIKPAPRIASRQALLAVAVSSDGALVAVGGGDHSLSLFDARSNTFVQRFPGHRDAVTCLAFRHGTHQLFSGSLDRTVKLWSMDDKAYMDTLFGHQAEVLSLDVGRAERAVSCGADRTCRVWKVPEESQLIFKHGAPGAGQSLDCCRYITGTEWLSGACDSSLQLWTQLKRKPVAVVAHAHGSRAAVHGGTLGAGCAAQLDLVHPEQPPTAPDVTGWVQSVAVCKGTDLVASGAGDGYIRLWQVTSNKAGHIAGLAELGGLPARGWINGLAIGRSAQLVVAAAGQEPRLGRWARDGVARNGLLVHRLQLSE